MAAAEGNNHAAAYYFGRPTNSDPQKPPAVPPAAKEAAVDEKVNAPPVLDVPGYYKGRVRPAAASDQQRPHPPQHNTEPGFLAKCLMCFSGGRTAR